ncbi:hypothetical protein RFI_04322 [Reticulomyxa filosa]|uniref:Uncharacterized protein n=1 Tax=Reticulomyxa filosa TaxID=46433 RepID=X6P3U4_RETFI|nr:hypothetical protein RFI_04322 [Reticulomyxa filosa]|eukprot:ETO32798.1 hypothetical protein RFI_04322 [Reticulomyxa filosa]
MILASDNRFEPLLPLPIPLYQCQCIAYKHEILICGGQYKIDCYSYHTVKNEYKYICSYPRRIILIGHCVVKLNSNTNPNEITLLSFGGAYKHALIMKYVSVWDSDSEDKKEEKSKIEKSKYLNEWLRFKDNNNKQISIGAENANYEGARAVIGGSKKHLLFITYSPKNIDIFNLNTFQCVTHTSMPVSIGLCYHNFVIRENEKELSVIKIEKKKTELILFFNDMGLAIDYDETIDRVRYFKIHTCSSIIFGCRCIYINDIFIFFNALNREIYKYSTIENKWMQFEHTLPIRLDGCAVILNEDKTFVHIIGGKGGNETHVRTKAEEWMKNETEKEKQSVLREAEMREIKVIERHKNGLTNPYTIENIFQKYKSKVDNICYHICNKNKNKNKKMKIRFSFIIKIEAKEYHNYH